MNLFKVNIKDSRTRSLTMVNSHSDYNHFRDYFHCFTHAFPWSKVFMELLMENKGKVKDNYKFNLKFTVPKTWLKMLCHVAFIRSIYCITDMICTVSWQEIEVARFLGLFNFCLFLSYVNQTTQSNLSNWEYGISKIKTNFIPPR